ncbi:MAG: CoA-binding protein [Gammaproteobacteria bacterium]
MDSHNLRRLFEAYTSIAVLGLSNKKHRESYAAAKYLQEQGYRVIPVNPRFEEILGERCYPNLRAIPERIDIVNCFVRSDRIPAIAEEAIAVGAPVLWLQLGIVNEEAARRAVAAGLEVVMDRCIMLEHKRLLAQ